jgi:hypothetical protein
MATAAVKYGERFDINQQGQTIDVPYLVPLAVML